MASRVYTGLDALYSRNLTLYLTLQHHNPRPKLADLSKLSFALQSPKSINLTPSRFYHASIRPCVTYHSGQLYLHGQTPEMVCSDLIKELKKTNSSISLAFDAIELAKLDDKADALSRAWLLFKFIQNRRDLQSHLILVGSCIRDLTLPNIDVEVLEAITGPMIAAGEADHYIQSFLLPKLKSVLNMPQDAFITSTLSECFEKCGQISFQSKYDAPKLHALLRCFVYALRADGDISSAIIAASALTHHLIFDCTYMMLLELHLTGIAAFNKLPQHMGKPSGDVSQLYQAFHKDALKALGAFSPNLVTHCRAEHYEYAQYYVHSLFLLGRQPEAITFCNAFIKRNPDHKQRFLPWILLAQASEAGAETDYWPWKPLDGLYDDTPPLTTMLEAKVASSFFACRDSSKSQRFQEMIPALAERYIHDYGFHLDTTSRIRALESAFASHDNHRAWIERLEPLNEHAHSRLITTALARHFAIESCRQSPSPPKAMKAIKLFQKLWPRLGSADWHFFGLACEITGDCERAIDSYSKSGANEVGNTSRIYQSLALAKAGRFDDSKELYNKICSEKKLYNSDDWNLFDREWGLFLSGRNFSFGYA